MMIITNFCNWATPLPDHDEIVSTSCKQKGGDHA